jgi:hypothetical protein
MWKLTIVTRRVSSGGGAAAKAIRSPHTSRGRTQNPANLADLPQRVSRSKVHTTSLAVNGLPSCQVTPSRSGNVSSVPSSFHDQLIARSGTIDCRLFCFTCWSAQGERMRAVIMMTDMRNFTGLSDRLPGDAVIELLDDYFDAIVLPIQENKGEVLKFMGDGVLAIFPTEDDEDFAPSSLRALAAATQGLERLVGSTRSAGKPSGPRCGPGSGCIWARSSTAMSALPTGSTSP